MKRKVLKSLIATAICVSMLGMNCFAAPGTVSGNTVSGSDMGTPGGSGTSVDGENDVENPIYKIVVPTKLEFAVDAFEQKGDGQIAAANYYMINKSNVPVKMDVAIKLAANVGHTVEFVSSASEVADDETTHSLYMEAVVASAVTETKAAGASYVDSSNNAVTAVKNGDVYYLDNTVAEAVEGGGVKNYPSVTNEMIDVDSVNITYPSTGAVSFPLGTAETKFSFALNGSEYIDYYSAADTKTKLYKDTAAGNEGTACFTFSGIVNSNIIWASKEFKATAVYTFNGMQTSKYDELTPITNAQGLMADSSIPKFTTGPKGVINFTPGKDTDAVASIKSVMMTSANGEFDAMKANGQLWSAAAVNKTAGTITLDAKFVAYFNTDSPAKVTYITSGGAEVTVTVTVKCTD